MRHGPLDSSGYCLLPSPLLRVSSAASRWANVHDEIPLALIDDYGNMRAAEPVVRHCAVLGLPNRFQ